MAKSKEENETVVIKKGDKSKAVKDLAKSMDKIKAAKKKSGGVAEGEKKD